jgi:hypothetical protein
MLDVNKKYNYILDIHLPIDTTIYEIDMESISNYNFYPVNPCFYIRETPNQYRISLIYSLSDFDEDTTKFILALQSDLYHIFIENIPNSLTTYKDIKFKKFLSDTLYDFLNSIETHIYTDSLEVIKLDMITNYGDITFCVEDILNKTVEDIKILQ